MSQARFQKQQREKARRERAEAKAVRKEERKEAKDADSDVPAADEAPILEQLAALHARFADEQITFEEFEEAKDELTARLDVR